MVTELGPNYENVQKWSNSESFLEIENDSLDAEGNISEIQTTSLFPPAVPQRISVRLWNLKHHVKLKAGVMKK